MRRSVLYASLLCLLPFISACNGQSDVVAPDIDVVSKTDGVTVYETDSDEWRVQIFKEHLLYSEAAAVSLPAPWVIPSREDAAILRQLSYPSEERFVTSDGYTFGMPSASVSKAGSKTKYSVLGLWRRRTTIVIEF